MSQPVSVEVTVRGVARTVYREQIEAAASRLTPVHGSTALHHSWYALVGGGLHYVGVLAAAAGADVDVRTARLLLHDLGFPVMAYAWTRATVAAPHPDHG
ncbi:MULTISPECIES: hypothetical protein [unclassified Streptomyces]|uniref:hypothetical protein n=1 Tax=unclassified Streptomyces TaxID=2593676 RepID=UPI00341F9615